MTDFGLISDKANFGFGAATYLCLCCHAMELLTQMNKKDRLVALIGSHRLHK